MPGAGVATAETHYSLSLPRRSRTTWPVEGLMCQSLLTLRQAQVVTDQLKKYAR